ncbi:MAG: CBS domain-containing protein [Bdellovibrionia bacterium]
MKIPKIGEVMSRPPRTIGEDIPVSKAKAHMQRDRIRHLPVLSAGRLVGIISDRDIRIAESFQGPGELLVKDIMTPEPYVVSEDEPLDEVLLTMADNKYGCALVQHPDSQVVIGIFTDTDALRSFGEYLQKQIQSRAA